MQSKTQAILKIILIVFIIIVLLKLCLLFLWPFLLSVLLVILLEPIVTFLCNKGLSRKLSVFIGFIIFALAIVFLLVYLSNYLYIQTLSFLHNLPNFIELFLIKFKYTSEIKIDYDKIIKTIQNIIPEYRNNIISTMASTINGFIYIIIVFITTIFISIDLKDMLISLKKILPIDFYTISSIIIKKTLSIINVEVKLILFTTVQTVVGLFILGVNKPLTIGLLCGILDLLPIVGTILIFLPWVIYSFVVGKFYFAIGLIFLFGLLQISRQFLEIKFMGNNLRIHPVLTIFALYIGVILYGLWGVILGPIIIMIVKELINKYFEGRRSFLL